MDKQFTIITSVRNERVRILEWAVYHRLIGFNNIVVYYNDCTDGTDEILEAMSMAGIVTAISHEPRSHMTAQAEAFSKAMRLDSVYRSDWLIAMDTDEYVNVHLYRGQISDLVESLPNADLITFSNRLFGSNGRLMIDEGNSLRQFTKASHLDHPKNALFKTFRRGHPLGSHPFFVNAARMVNGSGLEIDKYPIAKVLGSTEPPRLPAEHIGYGMVQLNHYAVRSAYEFALKRFRGSRTGSARFNEAYWRDHNTNDVDDLSIIRWADAVDTAVARYRMAAPAIDDAINSTRGKFKAILEQAKLDPGTIAILQTAGL